MAKVDRSRVLVDIYDNVKGLPFDKQQACHRKKPMALFVGTHAKGHGPYSHVRVYRMGAGASACWCVRVIMRSPEASSPKKGALAEFRQRDWETMPPNDPTGPYKQVTPPNPTPRDEEPMWVTWYRPVNTKKATKKRTAERERKKRGSTKEKRVAKPTSRSESRRPKN